MSLVNEETVIFLIDRNCSECEPYTTSESVEMEGISVFRLRERVLGG